MNIREKIQFFYDWLGLPEPDGKKKRSHVKPDTPEETIWNEFIEKKDREKAVYLSEFPEGMSKSNREIWDTMGKHRRRKLYQCMEEKLDDRNLKKTYERYNWVTKYQVYTEVEFEDLWDSRMEKMLNDIWNKLCAGGANQRSDGAGEYRKKAVLLALPIIFGFLGGFFLTLFIKFH